MVIAGLGRYLIGKGKKTGYFKPVVGEKDQRNDTDALFMKNLYNLDEPVETISPAFGDENQLKSGIKEAYAKASQGKDVMIIEGNSDYDSKSLVEALNARVIVVTNYSGEVVQKISSTNQFGERLAGVILNKIPGNRMEHVKADLSVQIENSGISVLGTLPEDRSLYAITTGQLARYVRGDILNNIENSAELVENLMVGAMVIDSGPSYFGRKTNKAALIRSERPDMQMAALETPTRCLVVAGSTSLKPVVTSRAAEKNVPIIQTGDDINTVINNIEEALVNNRFNQENKMPKLIESIEQNLDFQKINKVMGIAG
jgi:BioD-like phosphotransacetylase family protein